MQENEKLEVDMDFIDKLYMIADLTPPNYEDITLDSLKKIVNEIEDNINKYKIISDLAIEESNSANSKNKKQPEDKRSHVLIIDDLCIITYQLGVLFKNLGYRVTVARDIHDAIKKYKNDLFNLVIVDLFLPTEKEGFMLLDELIKLRDIKKIDTVIGMMTASARKEHREACKEKGAGFYIEKEENWQKNLAQLVLDIVPVNNL